MRHLFQWILLILFSFQLHACGKNKDSQNNEKAILNLTQNEADLRKRQIDNVDYQLQVDLTNSQENFKGQVTITFDFKGEGENVKIDFYGGKINNVALNNQALKVDYDGRSIYIRAIRLDKGKNQLVVDFEHDYSQDGTGLYRYVDPEDDNVYFYTQFEDFYANTVFPCFDQPNLKATFTLSVIAHNYWKVISATRETAITALENDKSHWSFAKSKRFSTYLFSLHAGAYAVFEDTKFRYPLRLFTRQAFAQYVDPLEWFDLTKKGFDFFERYFNFPYAYEKYDQLIVPDFNSGAMENVAAVTFTERYFPRGKQTHAQKLNKASTLFHEMSHMWFGNLVTMSWWDNLWLNESFASFMEPLALESIPAFKDDAWIKHFQKKEWAYWYDQQYVTHPVHADIPDTQTSRTNFDGISYGKGAAALKQLRFKLGDETFQKGIQDYFKTFAEKNTTLEDFMGTLSRASQKDLTEWTDTWLKQAGVNRLIVDFLCENNKVSSLTFHQKASFAHPTLREHSTLLGFLTPSPHGLSVSHDIRADIAGAVSEITAAKGSNCGEALYPNYQDYGYFKITLDKKTIEYLMPNIAKVDDKLLRIQIWHTFWEMLRDKTLSLAQFQQMALHTLTEEKNTLVLRSVLYKLYSMDNNSPSLLYYLRKQDKKRYQTFVRDLEKVAWQQLQHERNDLQYYWFLTLTMVTETTESLNQLAALLASKHPYQGLTVDQDKRWMIIQRLSETGHADAKRLITQELNTDNSLEGVQSALACRAALPDKAIKKQLIAEAVAKDSPRSLTEKKAIFNHLYPINQETYRADMAKGFFTQLLTFIDENREDTFLNAFMVLAPHDCKMSTASEQFLLVNKHLPPSVKKAILINQYENEKCGKITSPDKIN